MVIGNLQEDFMDIGIYILCFSMEYYNIIIILKLN